ncbi:hypothetical protein D3C72_2261250 [compost metagenome]
MPSVPAERSTSMPSALVKAAFQSERKWILPMPPDEVAQAPMTCRSLTATTAISSIPRDRIASRFSR